MLAFVAGLAMLALIPLASPLFNWIAHDTAVRQHEITYFRIMCFNPIPMLAAVAFTTFFTGRGKTWTVLYVNAAATLVNIVLDYGLIFGRFHLPAWGIAGAAWATVASSAVAALAFGVLFLRPIYRSRFNTLAGARPDLRLFGRLLRFGLPNGVQFMLDILAFTIFINLVGRTSPVALAATNITFQINMLAFMPMIGMGIAVTTLVGQALGANDASRAQRTTWSGFYLTFAYMTVVAVGYILIPHLFLYPFAAGSDPDAFARIEPLARQLLIFVALYSIFDGGNIIFAGALKGAGDTRFVMIASVGLSWLLLALPSYLAIKYHWGPRQGLFVAWAFLTLYVCALACTFLLRFLQGKWQSMRVIETPPAPLPTAPPAIPITDPQ